MDYDIVIQFMPTQGPEIISEKRQVSGDFKIGDNIVGPEGNVFRICERLWNANHVPTRSVLYVRARKYKFTP